MGTRKSEARKPILDYKVIQNVQALVGDRSKSREWNVKFINAMAQVIPEYEPAIRGMMKTADEDGNPDLEE